MSTTARAARPLAVALAGAWVVGVAYGMGRYVYGLTLPALREDLDLPSWVAGAIGGGTFAGFLAALLAIGPLSRRRGPRAPVLAGAVLGAGGAATAATASGAPLLAVGAVVTGASAGLVWAPFSDLLSRVSPAERRPALLALVTTGTSAGLVGLGVAGLAADPGSWRTAWVATALLSTVSALLVLGVVPRLPCPGDGSADGSADSGIRARRRRRRARAAGVGLALHGGRGRLLHLRGRRRAVRGAAPGRGFRHLRRGGHRRRRRPRHRPRRAPLGDGAHRQRLPRGHRGGAGAARGAGRRRRGRPGLGRALRAGLHGRVGAAGDLDRGRPPGAAGPRLRGRARLRFRGLGGGTARGGRGRARGGRSAARWSRSPRCCWPSRWARSSPPRGGGARLRA